jgi:hypothetical protein
MSYRRLIERLLRERAEIINRQPVAGLETYCVFDEERDHYLLVTIGWDQRCRVRGASLYLRIKDGKIWIEEDMTEDGIANQLVSAGVPSDDIVLAFQPPEMRTLTEFAVR